MTDDYSFPIINIYDKSCYFNKSARKYIPTYFQWRLNADWCMLVQSAEYEPDAYRSFGEYCTLPVSIQRSVPRGTRKLYKFDGGVAFKRYETIDVPGRVKNKTEV